MSRKEGDRNLVVLEDVNRCRRVAPRSERVDCCNWDVAVELLESSSADHGNVNGACIGRYVSKSFCKSTTSTHGRKKLGGLPC